MNANYTKVAGGDLMTVMAGSFIMRVELVAGGRTRLDYLSFDTMPSSAIQGGTWGSIKALYR